MVLLPDFDCVYLFDCRGHRFRFANDDVHLTFLTDDIQVSYRRSDNVGDVRRFRFHRKSLVP